MKIKIKKMVIIMNNSNILSALSTTDNGIYANIVRSAYTYNGNVVPRVTEILSKCIHSDSLMYWANSLGFKHKSYKKTLEMYANWGTQCHNKIDSFIESQYINREIPKSLEAANAFNSFLLWWDDINQNNEVIVKMHEQSITCPYFGGTLDGLYEINGKLYLVDYKTSNYVTFKYCLQLAAYMYILRTEYGINIDGCIILQLSKKEIGYNEYFLNFDNPEHLEYMEECEHAFLSIIYSYYNIIKVEEGFNNINWEG